MTAQDLTPDEKAEVARFGIHDEGPGLPVVRVERKPATEHRMMPGSHERASGPECACGAAWSMWQRRCVQP